jgi:phytoene synthase
MAYEGFHAPRAIPISTFEERQLGEAYETCEAITRYHSKTFYMASALLPFHKRRGARALYAISRITDDIVDTVQGDPGGELAAWRGRLLQANPPADDPVIVAWADTRARYAIPQAYVEQLIDGVARDLQQSRYATFADLAAYSYGVASTVGLMAMHIVGFAGPEAIPYAVKLGVALQLTNVLRDVREDCRRGRIYLPLDELAAHGISEEDLDNGRLSEGWRSFMTFQIERNRRLYEEALTGVSLLHADGRFSIAAAAELYRAILRDIEDHGMDVFSRRAHIDLWGKLRRLPGIWWRARAGYPEGG